MSYRVYALNGMEMSACSFYRIIQPLAIMTKLGLPIDAVLDDGRFHITQHTRSSMFLESDIDLIYQNTGEYFTSMMEGSKKFKPIKAESGEIQWPPSFIVDTDDDLFNVMPLNITFGSLGTRVDGKDLEDGAEIGVAHPFDLAPLETEAKLNRDNPYPLAGLQGKIGDTRYIFDEDSRWHRYLSLWKDGKNLDIAVNRRRLAGWKKTVELATLVTCSTPAVADYIAREVGPHIPTFVSPNCINFDDYPTVDLREHPGEVRILWEGSSSHHEGLWPISEAIRNVGKKYPQVTWVFWGAPYKWATQNLPNSKFVNWVPYEAYKLKLSTIGHDISIAPLAPSLFNQSRSAIRWYESSSIWRPAATLAQAAGAYKAEIQDGQTGMLFSTPAEFQEKLGALIEQETLRKTLASNAKDWVRTNREANQVITKLYHKWSEAREGHKQARPIEEIEFANTEQS